MLNDPVKSAAFKILSREISIYIPRHIFSVTAAGEFLLASLNRELLEFVLGVGVSAGGKVSEDARRIISLVEIDHNLSDMDFKRRRGRTSD